MSQLVRLEGKHTTQNAHCALETEFFCGIHSEYELNKMREDNFK